MKGRTDLTYPNVCEYWRVRGLAILPKVLRNNRHNSQRNPQKTILINARPNNIKPRQATPRGPPNAPLPPTAFLKPIDRQHPRAGSDAAEVGFLLVEVGRDVVAEEGEEGGDGKGFVAAGDYLEVDCVPVEPEGEEGGDGVDGDHEQDSDYAGEG